MMNSGLRAVALAAMLLAACRSVPPVHYYDFGGERHAAAVSTTTTTIGVAEFAVDPPFDQDQLVYRIGNQVGFYRTHRWAAPLGQLLALEFGHQLSAKSSIARFEPTSAGRNHTLVLRGRVVSFEEVDHAEGQQIRIALDLELVDGATPLWSQRFESKSEVRTEDVRVIIETLRHDLFGLIQSAGIELDALLRNR